MQILNRKSDSKGKPERSKQYKLCFGGTNLLSHPSPQKKFGRSGRLGVLAVRRCVLAISLCSGVSTFSAGGQPAFISGMTEYDFGSQN